MTNTNKTNVVAVSELGVKELKKVASIMNLEGRSKWAKDALIYNIEKNYVTTVTVDGEVLAPIVNEIEVRKDRKKMKLMAEALMEMTRIAGEHGVANPYSIIDEVAKQMRNGVKLGQMIANADNLDIPVQWMPAIRTVKSEFDFTVISMPTRKAVVAIEVVVREGVIDEPTGMLKVKGKLVRQNQSHLFDVTSKKKDYFKKLEDGSYARCHKDEVGASRMVDGTHISFVDFNMPLEEGQTELTETQKQMQFVAMNGGLIIDVEGKEVIAEYMYQTPSQQRLVQATFVSEMDAVEVLTTLGHDFRTYAKKQANGNWKIDMSKAIKRFGLSGTNTISSALVKIGKNIERFENGDLHLTGGTHTMRVTQGAHAFVKQGLYKVYDDATKKFRTIDAQEYSRMLAAGDGQVFCDESVYNALVAEFGLDTSAWQIRITPFTKGLMIFVPELKNLYGADIVAFDTAVKGNYETLIQNQKDFDIELRVALFNKPAKMAKKYTNIPYQFVNTLPLGHTAYIEMVDGHLDRAFELYENPKLMAEYLGLNILADLEGMSEEELTDEQREHAHNTLVSRFTEFLYSGEFTMKDPMMKKYAKDIIENVIKQWSFGAVPVEGHYRFMVQDPYAIIETKLAYDECEAQGVFNPYKDGEGNIIIPSHIGIPADRVVMIDDNDEFMMDGVDVVCNRNPKIAFGETALVKTIVTESYYRAHKVFKKAFVNMVIFSVHDFNTFKQGGADNDGDTTFAMTEPAIVKAVKESIHRFPAILDITFKDGEFVEGCPYSNPEMDKNEFVREFSDKEYKKGMARELHELSKQYVLRGLEPNDIGLLTNYATKILDAVTKLTIAVNDGIALDGSPLTVELANTYKSEISRYLHMVDVLRMVQGWEIDKAKHGGYYKLFMDLSFITEQTAFPFYATELDKAGKNRVWFTPDWMAARKGRNDGKKTGSLIQRIREHVVARFEKEIKEKFENLDPANSDNNISVELANAIQKPAHYDDVIKAVRIVKSEYTRGMIKAIEYKNENMAKLEMYTTHANGKPVTEVEKMHYEAIIEKRFSSIMDSAVTTSQARMSALEVELNVHPAILGVAAYEIVYADNNNINRNVKEEKDPTVGLSFPWSGAKFQLNSAVRLVSGKDMRFTNIEKVEASGVKINIGNLTTDAEWIKQTVLGQGKVYIQNAPINEEGNPLNGFHVFKAMVLQKDDQGKLAFFTIGHVFANKAHAFSGHDKWEVKVKEVSYKVNTNTQTVRSMSLELDTVNPIVRH
jgi:hypothetical protein